MKLFIITFLDPYNICLLKTLYVAKNEKEAIFKAINNNEPFRNCKMSAEEVKIEDYKIIIEKEYGKCNIKNCKYNSNGDCKYGNALWEKAISKVEDCPFIKESIFIVSCIKCGYQDKLNKFHFNTCDISGYIECPKCKQTEEF